MLTHLRRLLCLLSLFTLSHLAPAQGLVQLGLEGTIEPEGGALVEVLWEVKTETNGTRVVNLRLHLAQGTSAHDVGRLLAANLKRQGVVGVFPGDAPPKEGPTQLFVGETTVLRLRLPPGMRSRVTACDAAPTRVRLLPADAHPGPGHLRARTTTIHPHTRKTGSVVVEKAFGAQESPNTICEALFVQGLERDLVVDRPTQDSWRPIRGNGGTVVVGCSIELNTPGADWGLELRMGAPLR